MEREKIRKYFRFSVFDMVEMAMLIALAVIFDIKGLKISFLANGGSISLTMVPLIILCLLQGPFKGFIGCGIVYGFITCLLDGYGLVTYPFDYLLGYGSLCVIGFFSNIILKGEKITFKGKIFLSLSILVAGSLRLLSSTISGIIFYELGFIDSLIYNVSYIGFSVLACIVVLILLYKPILLINKRYSNY